MDTARKHIVSIRRPYTAERVHLDASTATGDDLRQIAGTVGVPHWHYETDDQIRPRVLKAMAMWRPGLGGTLLLDDASEPLLDSAKSTPDPLPG